MKMARFSVTGKAVVGCVLLALLVSGHALANSPNSVPASFSFEVYADGAEIVGTNGWYGEPGLMLAVATNQPYPGQTPLPDPHDRIAALTGPVSNLFEGTAAITNVWMDLLIQPQRWQQDEPPAPGTIPADAQVVLYVDTNGHINALCNYYDIGITNYANEWATFEQVSFDTNDWLRLTMSFRYQAAWGESYFQIQVDNSEVLTNQFGQTTPGDYDSGGSWFLCVNKSATNFNSVTFTGNSAIDDLVITNGMPDIRFLRRIRVVTGSGSTILPAGPTVQVPDGEDQAFTITTDTGNGYELTNLWWGAGLGEAFATNAIAITNVTSMAYSFMNVTSDYTIKSEAYRPLWEVGDTASKGTSIEWLYLHELDHYATPDEAEDGNDDADPKLNWEEYVTGTDPTNSASYFRVTAQGHGSPSNFVSCYITTNSGVTTAVDIYRSTDLLTTDWGTPVGSVGRNDSGISTWWDVNAPTNMPAFYKPVVEWTAP